MIAHTHRNLNARGYRVSGCPMCELRYRMAWRPTEAPDSATENMAACAWAVVIFLLVFLMAPVWVGADLLNAIAALFLLPFLFLVAVFE